MLLRLPFEVLNQILTLVVENGYETSIQYTCKYLSYAYLQRRYELMPVIAKSAPVSKVALAHIRDLRLIKLPKRTTRLEQFINLRCLTIVLSHKTHWSVLENLPSTLNSLTLDIDMLHNYAYKWILELRLSSVPFLQTLTIQSSKVIQKRLENVILTRHHFPGSQRLCHMIYHKHEALGRLLYLVVVHFSGSLRYLRVRNIDLYVILQLSRFIEMPELVLLVFDNCSLTNLNLWLSMMNNMNPRTSQPFFYVCLDYLENTILTSTSNNRGNWSSFIFREVEISRIRLHLGV